jgi:hypothetical protein
MQLSKTTLLTWALLCVPFSFRCADAGFHRQNVKLKSFRASVSQLLQNIFHAAWIAQLALSATHKSRDSSRVGTMTDTLRFLKPGTKGIFMTYSQPWLCQMNSLKEECFWRTYRYVRSQGAVIAIARRWRDDAERKIQSVQLRKARQKMRQIALHGRGF